MSISSEIVSVIIVLAAISVIQFFRGRKLNLQLIEYYMKRSLEAFKPVDKNFTWIGGYIGYKAEFKLKDGMKMEYTLTLLPRQSLFYFPISLLTHKHDRLYVVFRLKKLNGEAHLIKKGFHKLKPKIENEIALKKEIVKIGDSNYELLYDKRKYAEWLTNFLKGFSNTNDVKHLSLTPSTKVLYILMKPNPETILRDFEYMHNSLRNISELD